MSFKFKILFFAINILMGFFYCTLIRPGEIVPALFIIVWISMLAELAFYERRSNDDSGNR